MIGAACTDTEGSEFKLEMSMELETLLGENRLVALKTPLLRLGVTEANELVMLTDLDLVDLRASLPDRLTQKRFDKKFLALILKERASRRGLSSDSESDSGAGCVLLREESWFLSEPGYPIPSSTSAEADAGSADAEAGSTAVLAPALEARLEERRLAALKEPLLRLGVSEMGHLGSLTEADLAGLRASLPDILTQKRFDKICAELMGAGTEAKRPGAAAGDDIKTRGEKERERFRAEDGAADELERRRWAIRRSTAEGDDIKTRREKERERLRAIDEAARKARRPAGTWACRLCTTENWRGATVCAGCRESRGGKPADAEAKSELAKRVFLRPKRLFEASPGDKIVGSEHIEPLTSEAFTAFLRSLPPERILKAFEHSLADAPRADDSEGKPEKSEEAAVGPSARVDTAAAVGAPSVSSPVPKKRRGSPHPAAAARELDAYSAAFKAALAARAPPRPAADHKDAAAAAPLLPKAATRSSVDRTHPLAAPVKDLKRASKPASSAASTRSASASSSDKPKGRAGPKVDVAPVEDAKSDRKSVSKEPSSHLDFGCRTKRHSSRYVSMHESISAEDKAHGSVGGSPSAFSPVPKKRRGSPHPAAAAPRPAADHKDAAAAAPLLPKAATRSSADPTHPLAAPVKDLKRASKPASSAASTTRSASASASDKPKDGVLSSSDLSRGSRSTPFAGDERAGASSSAVSTAPPAAPVKGVKPISEPASATAPRSASTSDKPKDDKPKDDKPKERSASSATPSGGFMSSLYATFFGGGSKKS